MAETLSLFDWGAPPRPPPPPKQAHVSAFSMRPYQALADAAIDRELSSHRSTLVVMATGTGKTVLFSSQAAKRGGALVLADRDALVTQAAEKLHLATGEHIAIEKAERTAFASPYIVASVQTLYKARLERFAERFRKQIKFIIVDEADLSIAPSYRKIFDAFPEAQILGVTATIRADGLAMGNVYESVAFEYQLGAATEDGWLTPIKIVPIHTAANLDAIKLKGRGENRDFDQGQLEDAIADHARDVVRSLLDQCGEHRLIVFTPGVATAHAIADAMNLLRPAAARAVDGTMDDAVKRDAAKAHQQGEYQFLVNCGVYVRGYDDPNLDGMFDCATTKSATRARQKWGRTTRILRHIESLPTPAERREAIAASKKPWAMIYDLTFNTEKHDLISPADDLLAGKATDDEIKRVKEKLKKNGGDVDGALRDVRAEIEADRRAVAARAAAAAKQRTSVAGKARTIWDLLSRKAPASSAESRLIRPEDRPSPWMFQWMRRSEIPVPPDMTKREFYKIKKTELLRLEKGLCALRSVRRLGTYGIDATGLSAMTARAVLDAIGRNHGRPLPLGLLSGLLSRDAGSDG